MISGYLNLRCSQNVVLGLEFRFPKLEIKHTGLMFIRVVVDVKLSGITIGVPVLVSQVILGVN